MKKSFLLPAVILILLVSFLSIKLFVKEKSSEERLRDVLYKLEQINSATYYATMTPFAPGDTVPAFTSIRYYKEYVNRADTFQGASFVWFQNGDTSMPDFCYDGHMKATAVPDEKTIVIDSLKSGKSSLRYINGPFFTKIKTLLQYALETNDSILIESNDMGTTIQYSFSIYDTIAEVIGNRIIYFPNIYGSSKGEVSRYQIWIDKSDGLPYRLRREMPHDISVTAIKDVKLNHILLEDFKATDYFPSDFSIQYSTAYKEAVTANLVGKTAPDWVLRDSNNNIISLENLESKVILIQFTGVSCGACLASIPFLNQLDTEYDNKDFKLVSIECWSKSWNALSKYQERNNINYTFIRSSKEVSSSYQIQGVPRFFILDENRVVREVIKGYGKGSTDKKIRDAINKLI
ncbi:MAG: TlpA family protein disulfide reductase [Bacteroidales bacterium]|nr:TlpA family protein disulfide reductase [Bacteroidales bacterium]MCF8350163.1 TlpA family protein disulfide reductase [Bacteroidales bacterium]